MFFSLRASPIVRTPDGGTNVPVALGWPFGRKPGFTLFSM